MRRVLITGGKGYIARNLRTLMERGGYEVFAPSRQDMNLLNFQHTAEYLERVNPNYIIHAATKGGRRTETDTFDDVFVPNIQMWDNLYDANMHVGRPRARIITFGSGAEFDRRFPIDQRLEEHVEGFWPVDPYGLSKNIITRKTLDDCGFTHVLRLFGCFNYDDHEGRFIKNAIANLKVGAAINVHQEKTMDYFYLDDIYTVIDHIIQNGNCPQSINLVYPEKKSLLDIASLVHKHMNVFEPIINLREKGEGLPYTGNGNNLASMKLKLIGLEEGIRRTVEELT